MRRVRAPRPALPSPALAAPAALVAAIACGPAPTPFSEASTTTTEAAHYLTVPSLDDGRPVRLFALGYDTHDDGPWDGVTGAGGCVRDEAGRWSGLADTARVLNERAVEAGANFAYVWSGRSKIDTIGGRVYGIWHSRWGERPAPEEDVVPVLLNGAGETDLHPGGRDERIAELERDFSDFRTRTGRFAPEREPRLPPYADFPRFAWHPTWRIEGGGSGREERTTDAQADRLASAATMMIADSYTYVVNRYSSLVNDFTGQRGEQGEGYEDWLAADDPEHRSYFDPAWRMISASVGRAGQRMADPAHPTVVWAWMQGHAFDDDIGRNTCTSGKSDLWARGPFPSMAYLRKEILSTVAAGGTGIVFFGYMYCRFPEAEKVRSLLRTLAHPEVYGPALLSPSLELGYDARWLGETGYDGRGRVHAKVVWDAEGRRAYVLGANPGARATRFELLLPWSVARVETLEWAEPAAAPGAEPRPARFVELEGEGAPEIVDREVRWTAPRDDGFIWRLTPAGS